MGPCATRRHISSASAARPPRARGRELAEGAVGVDLVLGQVEVLGTGLEGQARPERPLALDQVDGAGWLTWAAMARTPVSRATSAIVFAAVSSASRLRHSAINGRIVAARRAQGALVLGSDRLVLAVHQAEAVVLRTSRKSCSRCAASKPGTPCVVQVNTLKKVTPASHRARVVPS